MWINSFQQHPGKVCLCLWKIQQTWNGSVWLKSNTEVYRGKTFLWHEAKSFLLRKHLQGFQWPDQCCCKWCKGHCKVPCAQEMSQLPPQTTCALCPLHPIKPPLYAKVSQKWWMKASPPLIKILWRAARQHLRRNDVFRCLMKTCICPTKKKRDFFFFFFFAEDSETPQGIIQPLSEPQLSTVSSHRMLCCIWHSTEQEAVSITCLICEVYWSSEVGLSLNWESSDDAEKVSCLPSCLFVAALFN